MRDRIISGIIGGALLVVLLFSDTIIVNIAVSALGFAMLLEVFNALKLNKSWELIILSLAASFGFTYALSIDTLIFFVSIFVYLVLLFGVYMFRGDITLRDISVMFYITFFICMSLSCIVFIRKMDHGELYIWLIFISAFVSDMAGYFVGSAIGKHHPFPTLSPKKSAEGYVAGIATVILIYAGYGMLLQYLFGYTVSYTHLLFIGAITAMMGQFGDLAASCIKREYRIKDYGGILPGHGGLMDRFDSVLFVAPALYLLLRIIPII